MKWIKASERLPELLNNKCVKLSGIKYVAHWSPRHQTFINSDGDHFPPDQVEWLDESPGSDNVEFGEALRILRDLADIQNGPPLIKWEKQWTEIMKEAYEFLNKHYQP